MSVKYLLSKMHAHEFMHRVNMGLGKNVLHPNVGFMWEIIDHMWDDPTFLCGMIPHSLIIILGVEISEERNV